MSEIHYVHLRQKQEDGSLDVHGGATIAYIADDTTITCSLARCNVKDNFCRRVGRAIATGRLHNGLYARLPRPAQTDPRPDRKLDIQAVVDWATKKIEWERNLAALRQSH
jgi:hypothetical protein